eukprot:15456988-Alexandrium_andersonii.AAC.1
MARGSDRAAARVWCRAPARPPPSPAAWQRSSRDRHPAPGRWPAAGPSVTSGLLPRAAPWS